MTSDILACKFGGSSVADADQIRRVADILKSDPRRRYVVVSAPGKRRSTDNKITDLLYRWHRTAAEGKDTTETFEEIRSRFLEIASELGVAGAERWVDEVAAEIDRGTPRGRSSNWVASRGEYLSARIIAGFMGARFVDAADCILFGADGKLDPETYHMVREAVAGDGMVVIPGFYGREPNGRVKTFSRGGSDITGAIVARAVHAAAYENWTDVDGLLMADPRVVESPCAIRDVSYRELRELSYMGASVLHDEAIFPVREQGIPINIRNTNRPEVPGTWIRSERQASEAPVVGIAGRKGFTTILIEKSMMNQQVGFGRRVLEVLERHDISYEHAPSSIDSMSVIIETKQLTTTRESVLTELQSTLEPDRLEMLDGLAMIATVGQGMMNTIGISAKLFGALRDAGVNVRMINQGASEISIIVGIVEADFQAAIRAIYGAFAASA